MLDLGNLSMEEIKNMKKTSFTNMIKDKIQIHTFKSLEGLKKSHSKVEKVEHSILKIQKYLQPNSINMRKEDSQLIFRLRCRMTQIKVNLKGKYDTLECSACGIEEENQQHVICCKEINEKRSMENIKYENIFNGTVEEKLKIAKVSKENFDKLENMKK